MSFDQILKKLVLQVNGAIGAVFIDREGEAIAHYATFSVDHLKLMGAHHGIVWLEMETLTRRYLGFPAAETIILFEKGICLLRPLQKKYFVLLILTPSGSLGQARRWMQWALQEIQKEI